MHEHTGLWVQSSVGARTRRVPVHHPRGQGHDGVLVHRGADASPAGAVTPLDTGGVCAHPPWVRARAGCPCFCRGCVIQGDRAPLGHCAIRAVLGALPLLAAGAVRAGSGWWEPSAGASGCWTGWSARGCCPPGEVSQAVLAEFTARGSTLSSAWHSWAGCRVGAGDALPVPPISREHCSVAVRLG